MAAPSPMKKLLLTAAAILATLNSSGQTAQGVIDFLNAGVTDDRRIWVNNTGVVGEGTRAAGTGYRIALYWGPHGTPEAGLTRIGNSTAFLNGSEPFGPGTFNGGARTVTYPGNFVGDNVTVQARAWASIPSVPDSYEVVLAAGLAGDQRAEVGKGPLFTYDTGRPGDPSDYPSPVGLAAGWRGFSITPVPEPSVIALGLLGAGALLILRRRE